MPGIYRINEAEVVVLRIDDDKQRRRAERMLRDQVKKLYVLPRDSLPGDLAAAVILTDSDERQNLGAAADEALRNTATVWIVAGETSIFRFSEEALLTLPADCSARELQIAVSLAWQTAEAFSRLVRLQQTGLELARLAETDSLTELPNRRAWDEASARAVHQACERHTALCVALLDLDRLKAVNDAQGHAAGDAVLKAVAEGLRSAVRKGDFAARIGGDEFGLLLPDLPAEAAPAVLERIRHATAQQLAARGLPGATCSIGFWSGVPAVQDPVGLMQWADEALRRAKQAGRDRVEGF